MHQGSGIGVGPQIGRDWRERRAVAPVNLLNVQSPTQSVQDLLGFVWGKAAAYIVSINARFMGNFC